MRTPDKEHPHECDDCHKPIPENTDFYCTSKKQLCLDCLHIRRAKKQEYQRWQRIESDMNNMSEALTNDEMPAFSREVDELLCSVMSLHKRVNEWREERAKRND